MKYIALDVGTRRTGVSLYDDAHGIALALNTISHTSKQELIDAVQALCSERSVSTVILGLPLLPSGNEGAQSKYVRSIGFALEKATLTVHYLDERFSTPVSTPTDGDASAACEIMRMYVQRLGQK